MGSPIPESLGPALEAALARPRAEQPAALAALLEAAGPVPEEWNSRFGPGSLFDAWTQTSLAGGVYAANTAALRPLLDLRPGFRVIEVGGGDGRLWAGLLRPTDRGELVLIDPAAEVHAQVEAALPPGVKLRSILAPVEEALDLPDADALVCSLTLHHVAGRDRIERAAYGLVGPGKREILEAFAAALRAREGLGLLNEADIHCDLELAPGDPLLTDRLTDSYVRRCARGILHDIATRTDATADLRARWAGVLLHWCVGQLARAAAPVEDRDVYELDVPRWRALLQEAGIRVNAVQPTDPWLLFYQYRWRPQA